MDLHSFFFPFIRFLCQYNGFVVIMNSNHVFDIKARPMEQLKFIETNTSEREKKQALKQRAGYILISTHKNTPKALRLNLPVHFHCYPHFPTYFSFFIHWLVLLSTAGKKNARENSKRKKWKKHTQSGNHNSRSVNLRARHENSVMYIVVNCVCLCYGIASWWWRKLTLERVR